MAEPLENPVTNLESFETPLEMVETPLEMVETPLETVETPLETVETPLEMVETPLEMVETPAKKKGRPAGAKSSVQGKPRPKRVAANRSRKVPAELPPDEPDELPELELPPPLPNSRRIPQESHDDSSALMLTLLRKQAADRRQRKVDVWKSWFN
jgi:hypothetical protein